VFFPFHEVEITCLILHVKNDNISAFNNGFEEQYNIRVVLKITSIAINIMTQPIYWIFILAIPVACISWTVTKEEIFKEPREYCIQVSKNSGNVLLRKLFYMLTCEYCFSHYITLAMLFMTRYTLLYSDWRGYVLSGFSIVWIANVYMSLYNIIRIDLKKGKLITQKEEEKIKKGDFTS
jgi:hypothetical protein